MTSTAPCTVFKIEYFADSNQARAYQNLQHGLYRGAPGGARAYFLRSPGEGTIIAEIRDGDQMLVRATLRPFYGDLLVEVFGRKQVEARASFVDWEHPAMFGAVEAFILRAAER